MTAPSLPSTRPAKRKRSESETQDCHPPRKSSGESSSSNPRSLWVHCLKTLVVFGDSYSLSSRYAQTDDEASSAVNEMTWVDHLQAHLRLQNAAIRNFSFAGATAESDLETQTSHFFIECPPKKTPASNATLDPANTYYVLFLGINDCGTLTEDDDFDLVLEKVLDSTHSLYIKAGARKFIFIDVPPIDCAPGALEFEDSVRMRVDAWNAQLLAQVSDFARETPQATVFIFSAHAVITEILENPLEYDFLEDDATDEGGAIWTDELHVTTTVHKIMADRLLELKPLPPSCEMRAFEPR